MLTNLTRALATSRPIASCASSVEPADVRGQDDVGQVPELGGEVVGVAVGLCREDVGGRARQVAGAQRLRERAHVDHAAPAEVQEIGPGLHAEKLALADEASGERRLRHVQGDEVGLRQHRLEGLRRSVVPHRQLRRDVVEKHLHAERLGEHADLRADVTVADDSERLAADLVGGRWRPCATGPRASPASDPRGGGPGR